jgi:16S rRNA (cytidine1402-2'-O)-methyltransferase
VDQLLEGKKMALLTDAGTPGISDPAYFLIRECIKAGVSVECLPGATAFVPALVVSGLPLDSFCFEGFLPIKKGRHTMLTRLATEERTIVFYESPMRLVKTLQQLIEYFGAERQCSVSREISKKFEETKRGSLQEVHDHFEAKAVKGEIVIVVHGAGNPKKATQDED